MEKKTELVRAEHDVYVRTFGRFEVENLQGCVSENTSRKALPMLLLKYLLVNPGREVPVKELLEVIWPDADPDKGEATTRVRLTRLRSLLDPIGLGGKNGLVIHHKLNFILNPDYTVRTDADLFSMLSVEIRKLPAEDPEALALCGRALELYRGSFLQYTDKDFWFENIQESYHKDFCSLALDAAERICATGNSELLPLLSQRAQAFGGSNLELHRTVLGCIDRFSGETAKQRYVTQLMRSGFVADWLSAM